MRAPRQRADKGLSQFRNERGSVLVLVTLLLIAFLGLAALAIDLGLLYVARGEAQRAADAAAHAGAAYWMHHPNASDQEIKAEAERLGKLNLVRGLEVSIRTETDEDIRILRDEGRVWAQVHRTSERENPIRTLFGQIIGFPSMGVAADAAAELWPADQSQCVLPFAIPDRWCLNSGEPCAGGEYSDGMDATETWEDGHSYRPWSDPLTLPDGDIYWSGYSDDQFGNALNIRPSRPQETLQPGWFFPFRIPGTQGADDYREAIAECVTGDREWGVGDIVNTENGRMEGPTDQGFTRLLNRYPNADWDVTCDGGRGCAVGDPDHIAGRTRPVALFDPRQPPSIGNNPFEIVGFAAVFVQGFDADDNVVVYFDRLTGSRPADNRNVGGPNPQLTFLRIVE